VVLCVLCKKCFASRARVCVCVHCMLADDNDRGFAGFRQDYVGTDDGEAVSIQALQHYWHGHFDREDESHGTSTTQ